MKTIEKFKLPEKWCVLGDRQEVIDYSNINGIVKPYVINKEHYHHYSGFQYDGLYCTTSSKIEKGYTEITFEQFKKYVLKEEMENKEQKYELVDFKIEDLKKDDILEMDDAIIRVVHNYGEVVIVIDDEGKFSETYSSYELNVNNFKLQVPKPKLEKIQGFEVREYPELPLVEVSDDSSFDSTTMNVKVANLIEVKNKKDPFFDGRFSWKYCRPVPLERRNFIEVNE